MKVDMLVEDGKLLLSGSLVEASLAINEGKIVAVTKLPEHFKPEVKVKAGGKLVLPGAIDCHVHFREPGRTVKEDFETGSAAAAVGGVTTVFDMPNTDPPTTSLQAFKEKVEAASRRSLVDFSIWGGLSTDNLAEAAKLVSAGVVGFKVMASRAELARGAHVFTVPGDGGSLLSLMEEAVRLRTTLAFHCEDFSLRRSLEEKLKAQGRRDALAYLESIPSEGEASAAFRVLAAARLTGAKVHLVHVSSKLALKVLRWGKGLGLKVTAETCPHYLFLTHETVESLGPEAKIDPPIRGREDGEALWEAVDKGFIDLVASDHSPHTMEEKEEGWRDFWKAPPGFCGVETLLPLMLTQVFQGCLSLTRLVRLMAENPARAFGLWGVKGSLQPGFDADLVLVDPKGEWVIRRENLHSKSKVTPWDGWKVKGRIILTMVRGEVVAEGGEPVGKPGWGKLVKPKADRS
ncbi:MAG: allantoinase AllB [Candidatus Hecatellaceae archaeon]